MVQKYPPNSHILIMEHTPKYGEISSVSKTIMVESHNNTQNDDDLFKSMKGLLLFGKLIGVIPFSGIFGKKSTGLSFR